MNKKVMLGTASVLLALSLTAGSLSFFSATDSVTNVVTLGNIDCALTEPCYEKVSCDGEVKVMPGTKVNKDPTVTNTGDNNAWIFVKAEIVQNGETDENTPALPSFADLGIKPSGSFTVENTSPTVAVFSSSQILLPGKAIKVFETRNQYGVSTMMSEFEATDETGLLETNALAQMAATTVSNELYRPNPSTYTNYTMTIPDFDNEYQNASFDIKVTVYAIQSDNLTRAEARSKLNELLSAAEAQA